MEELQQAFTGSLHVDRKDNDTAAPHPRLSQFKQKGNKLNQEERRLSHLESQKRERLDYVNKARCLAEEDWDNYKDEEEDNGDNKEEEMESASSKTHVKRKERPRYYRNQLMLSEWLVEVPTDLAKDWLMVLCPVGKRTFVVAAKGKTSSYSRSGYRLSTFPSQLPGGCRKNKHNNTEYSLLDCIFHEASRTFYILDIMCWRGHPVYDSDTEFRFFWLHSKVADVPILTQSSSTNPFRFLPLPNFPCHTSVIEETMAKPAPFQADLDGILFYHKQTHYTSGSTPLVGWLMPWMLPDMLGVPVPDSIMASRPPGADMKPPDPKMEAAIVSTDESKVEDNLPEIGVAS
ncbi:snurportin-1-like [Asterias amurensis]|uniref:snurportin-1-like n=1 Tax=Asterias amurensis TaxID=7602 RepID=UPI003AB1DA16